MQMQRCGTNRIEWFALFTVALASVMFACNALSAQDKAKIQLQNLYVNKFNCHEAGFGTKKCTALEKAYAKAGYGNLVEDTSGALRFTVVGEPSGAAPGSVINVYTVSLPLDRQSMMICDFPTYVDVYEVRLYALLDEDTVDFPVPQSLQPDAEGCVTFTAPFTTELYSTGEKITVESFAGRIWVLDVRFLNADGAPQTIDLARITVP